MFLAMDKFIINSQIISSLLASLDAVMSVVLIESVEEELELI